MMLAMDRNEIASSEELTRTFSSSREIKIIFVNNTRKQKQ